MMRLTPLILFAPLFLILSSLAVAQQSDFAVKKDFEDRSRDLKEQIESAKSMATLDTLKKLIDALELLYSPRSSFLDKALYPETFAERIGNLRMLHSLTYDRVYLIQTRGIQISELESKLNLLTSRLDTLSAQKDRLFQDLQESRKNVAALRETIKRLTANLQAKDKLLYALVDSIFLPYGKDLNQVADVQKEAIGRKLAKANVVTRVYEIATDNVKFLEVTQLQGKDYANMIDQYQQFSNRWKGLREKIVAVAAASEEKKSAGVSTGKGKPGKPEPAATLNPGIHIDSLIAEWNAKLEASFWAGLAKEFSTRGVTVNPFNDPKSFSLSIRSYVESLKSSGQDPTVFVSEIWKARIDREWRDALSRESMLGKTEYAALDKVVSELSQQRVDQRFIIYSLIVVLVVIAGWWFFVRKPKPPTQEQKQPT